MKNNSKPIAAILGLIAQVLLLTVTSPVSAQKPRRTAPVQKSQPAPKVRFTSGNSALNIPLEIDNNIILMRVSVNNSKPLKLIFDTGATASVINSKRAGELGLKPECKVHGNATGGAIHGSFTKGVTLSVQGVEVSHQLIAAIPFTTPPGFDFDGTIGYDFINQFVIEIDYQAKTMNLYDPQTYAYSGDGEVVPLLLAGRKTPLVITQIILEGRAPLTAKLEVDTGADDTFVINSPFVKRQKLIEAMQKTTDYTRNGAAGEQQVLVGRFKAVRLGRFVLENPTAGLSLDTEGSGASRDNDGTIGGEVFRRFKVVLDYSRRLMFLEPNKSLNDPFEIDSGE